MNEFITKEKVDELFDKMAADWSSEFIARKKVEEFTGGMITGKTVANFEADKDKVGPPKIKLGRLSGYPKGPFVEWLKSRTVVKTRSVLEVTGDQA